MRGHAKPRRAMRCEARRGRARPCRAMRGRAWTGQVACGAMRCHARSGMPSGLSPAWEFSDSVLLHRPKGVGHEGLEKCFSIGCTELFLVLHLRRQHPVGTARRFRASAMQAPPPGAACGSCRTPSSAGRPWPLLSLPGSFSLRSADFPLPHGSLGLQLGHTCSHRHHTAGGGWLREAERRCGTVRCGAEGCQTCLLYTSPSPRDS